MAAVVPATKGTLGWIPPGTIVRNDAGASPNSLANMRVVPTAGLRHERWFFTDLDNAELWAKPPAGVIAFAIQMLSDEANIQAVSMNASRQMLVSASVGNGQAIVHTWSRGGAARASGTDVPPVSKGTAGFLNPAKTMLITDQDSGLSDPLTTGRFSATSQGALRHVVLYFTGVVGGTDTWTPPAHIVPKIVDYAWQGAEIADDMQIAWSSTAAAFFGAAVGEGWLHLWLR
jgi:hypothetical protein